MTLKGKFLNHVWRLSIAPRKGLFLFRMVPLDQLREILPMTDMPHIVNRMAYNLRISTGEAFILHDKIIKAIQTPIPGENRYYVMNAVRGILNDLGYGQKRPRPVVL